MVVTIAGKRPGKAKGMVIHNDAGGSYATAKSYESLLNADYDRLARGFAHFYIDEHNRVEIAPLDHQAWHTATNDGNTWYNGAEVCQSMGDEAQFLRNEQAAFKWCAEWFKSEGLTPNRETVRLHKEFSSTACPHRSWELHGQNTNVVKDYFISQILKYMNGQEEVPKVEEATTYGCIDFKETSNGKVRFKGWGFNTRLQPTNKEDLVAEKYTLFLIDNATGTEISRQTFYPNYRDDVADVFSRFKNVGYGAFDVTFDIDTTKLDGKLVFPMLRFSGVDTNKPKVEDIYFRADNIQI